MFAITSATILVINSGSSSIKFATVDPETGRRSVWGIAEALRTDQARLKWADHTGLKESTEMPQADYKTALQAIWRCLEGYESVLDQVIGIGHRVVHGGENITQSTPIDDDLVQYLDDISDLAPLHNPANVACIHAMRQLKPHLPQVAVFDTAFHQTMPRHAYMYALPYELYENYQVRRYGFHGTSHRYVAQKACDELNLDPSHHGLITAHLGNGCSLCAVVNGQSRDTTMGFTPLEGLVMGTRCGNIDPEIPLFLQTQVGLSTEEVHQVLNQSSGLLGLSGVSHDMRQLWDAADANDTQAQLAIDVFCYQLIKMIASFIPILPQLDALIFTGGIGENDARIRERVIEDLKPLGFQIDTQANNVHGKKTSGRITSTGSQPGYVVSTDEERMIAQDTYEQVSGHG